MTAPPPSGGPLRAPLRADLAAASRILAERGVVDAAGHVSLRHPGAADRFIIARAMAPALVTPDDLMEFDLDGVACAGDRRAGFLERFIHAEIYRARTDVTAVVHSHTPAVVPFGLVRRPMRAMFHNAAFLAEGVPVFDIRADFGTTDMLVCDCVRGRALARCIGDRPVALMRAHGMVACGPTLQLAVFRAVYTEVNARMQQGAEQLAAGGPIEALEPAEGRLADVANEGAARRAWELWRAEVRERTGW